MEYILFIIKSSLDDFRRNKLRTFLTSLGIFIGISSVVLLSALGLGLKRYIQNQFESLGTNLIMIMPGKSIQAGRIRTGPGLLTSGKFDEKDLTILQKINNISLTSGVFVKYSQLEAGDKAETYELLSSSPEIFKLLSFEIDKGLLFDKKDNEKRSKVVVLGSKPAEKIFGSADNAVSKTIKIERQNFKVIGVLKSKGGGNFGEPGLDDHVFIPFKSSLSFNPTKKYYVLYAKAYDETRIKETKDKINDIFIKRYHQDDFSVLDQQELLDTFTSIFSMLNNVLIGIAAISLVVGGVGIMNIMYVSVVERIREIGIRRSFGATQYDILFLFLMEAIILSLFGGFFGLFLSYLLVTLVQKFFPAYIDLSTIIVSFSISSLIGIVFGVMPARKAAKLTPVEAIRND